MEVEMIKGIEDWHPPKLETLHFTRMTKHCCLHQIYLHTLQLLLLQLPTHWNSRRVSRAFSTNQFLNESIPPCKIPKLSLESILALASECLSHLLQPFKEGRDSSAALLFTS
ncbi:hypothetical protein NC652_033216 [Populus alba x Populus x berolinensis]|nr:hypothetical protein NC652_033216 [Populus alba x Populus x berolinensis]